MERDIENSINKVIIYLSDLGITVDISDKVKESFCDLYSYKISIPEYDDMECILYSLLHEAGHFMVDAEGVDVPEIPDNMDVLINEVLAWDRGDDIAHALKLNKYFYDESQYWVYAKNNLFKYTALFNIKI